MNKKEVKNILISMRTPENEIAVNHLLGQLDMKSNTEIEQITERLGNSEQNIRKTLSKKIEMRKNILLMICLLMEYQGIVFTYTYQQTCMN